MKFTLLRTSLLLLATIFIAMGFSSKDVDLSLYEVEGLDLYYFVPNEFEITPLAPAKPEYQLFLGKTYVGFKEALAFKESRGNYSIINPYGYMGKYQFGESTLRIMGIHDPITFLNDTRQQEAAFSAYTSLNKWILRKDIQRYTGKTIGGVKITESGILAAAHLAGAGNVKKFLRSGGTNGFTDANGTSIRNYLRKFSDYDTSHIVANKKPKVK